MFLINKSYFLYFIRCSFFDIFYCITTIAKEWNRTLHRGVLTVRWGTAVPGIKYSQNVTLTFCKIHCGPLIKGNFITVNSHNFFMAFETAREALGDPFNTADNSECLIYNMDCVVGMQRLVDSGVKVHLLVTSPPYNIGKSYEENMPLGDYVEWCSKWLGIVGNLVSDKGAFWLNLGYNCVPGKAKALPLSYLLWDKVPMFFVQEIVWNYAAGVASRKSFSPRNEKFLFFVKDENSYTFNLDAVRDPDVKYPNQKKNGVLKCNPLGKNPTDVWQISKVTSGANRSSAERTEHPAQFPEAVIERIILVSSNPGDLILDPFMGSGTTAAVALRLGRKVIGFEISEGYCELIADRLATVVLLGKKNKTQKKIGFPPAKKRNIDQ
jgi:adenine-specific DNA-methyltransferase